MLFDINEMEEFLESHPLTRVSQEEIENPFKSIALEEIELQRSDASHLIL
jgi:hypothetical protein